MRKYFYHDYSYYQSKCKMVQHYYCWPVDVLFSHCLKMIRNQNSINAKSWFKELLLLQSVNAYDILLIGFFMYIYLNFYHLNKIISIFFFFLKRSSMPNFLTDFFNLFYIILGFKWSMPKWWNNECSIKTFKWWKDNKS